MKLLLEFIYPDFCIFCKNKADANDVFCSYCTKHLILEMDDTVMHVLEENPISIVYIKYIRDKLPKKHIQILAAFTVIKYFRIFNDSPSCVFSSKNKLANMIGKRTAKLLKIPFKKNISFLFQKGLERDEKIFFHLQNNEIKEFTVI